MKNLLFLLFVFATLSCKKHSAVNVPQWLQERITQMESAIKTNSNSGYSLAAWYQYGYKGQTYYQLHNPVSSLAYDVYNADGTRPDFSIEDYNAYQKERCCAKAIWQGPGFKDFDITF